MPEHDMHVPLSPGVVMYSPFAYDTTFDDLQTVEIDLAPIGVGNFR